jgi:hypothetical protein
LGEVCAFAAVSHIIATPNAATQHLSLSSGNIGLTDRAAMSRRFAAFLPEEVNTPQALRLTAAGKGVPANHR